MFEILFKSSIVSRLMMRTKWFQVNLQHYVLDVFPANVFDSNQSKSALRTHQVRIDHPLEQIEGCKGTKRLPLRPPLRLLRIIESNRSKGHKGGHKENLFEPCDLQTVLVLYMGGLFKLEMCQ